MATTDGTIVLTGANGGLGSAIAEQIASRPELSGYTGLYTVRSARNAATLNTALSRNTTHSHDVLALDLTNLDNVRQLADGINTRVATGEIPPVRALILNAGVQDFGHQSWTADGLDTTFAANYLGHWLLTMLLLRSLDKKHGRIVVIGSQSHDPHDPRNAATKAFDDPKYQALVSDAASFEAIAKGSWSAATEGAPFREAFPSGFRRYGASKLFCIMMQHELQARLDADPALEDICVLGVDPGTMTTGLQRLSPWYIRVLLFKIVNPVLLYMSPEGSIRSTIQSAGDVLEAAIGMTEGNEQPKDKYFFGRSPAETSAESKDPAKRKLVWQESARLAKLKEGETILANWQ